MASLWVLFNGEILYKFETRQGDDSSSLSRFHTVRALNTHFDAEITALHDKWLEKYARVHQQDSFHSEAVLTAYKLHKELLLALRARADYYTERLDNTHSPKERREVTMIFATNEYDAFLVNWLLYAHAARMHRHYIVVALDSELATLLRKLDIDEYALVDASAMYHSTKVQNHGFHINAELYQTQEVVLEHPIAHYQSQYDDVEEIDDGEDAILVRAEEEKAREKAKERQMDHYVDDQDHDVDMQGASLRQQLGAMFGIERTIPKKISSTMDVIERNVLDQVNIKLMRSKYRNVFKTRLVYLIWALELGFDVFHCDADVVLLDNVPLTIRRQRSASSSCDIEAQPALSPERLSHKWASHRTIGTGFYIARSRGGVQNVGAAALLRQTWKEVKQSDQSTLNDVLDRYDMQWVNDPRCAWHEKPMFAKQYKWAPSRNLVCSIGVAQQWIHDESPLRVCLLDEYVYMRRVLSDWLYINIEVAQDLADDSTEGEKRVQETRLVWKPRIGALHVSGRDYQRVARNNHPRSSLDKKGYLRDWDLWQVPGNKLAWFSDVQPLLSAFAWWK